MLFHQGKGLMQLDHKKEKSTMLPIDLVLVRHGKSEGNAAKRLSESGDHSAYTDLFRDRHTSSFRLTDEGRCQAALAGKTLRHGGFFPDGFRFDRFITSEYARAMETAGLLELSNASWYADYNLTERDWGELDNLPENERDEKFGDALRRRAIEPFFWRPPNGESFAQLCLRIDRVLQTLHRECSDKRVIIVCHGEVMRAFQVRLERLSQVRFKELMSSEDPLVRIYNCDILHYSRRDPQTGELARHANWVRRIRPTDGVTFQSYWTEIRRPRYSNEDLLRVVEAIPVMVR